MEESVHLSKLTFTCSKHGRFTKDQQWAICSPVWNKCDDVVCIELRQVNRQRDPDFSYLLNKARIGIPLKTVEYNLLSSQKPDFDKKKAVEIYPFRDKVEATNERKLKLSEGEPASYFCIDDYFWLEYLHPELAGRFERVRPHGPTSCLRCYSGGRGDERHRFEEQFQVKIGMPVILLCKGGLDSELANGSRGVVVGCEMYDKNSPPKDAKLVRNKQNRWVMYCTHTDYRIEQIKEFVERASEKKWPVVRSVCGLTCTAYPHCELQELGIVREDGTQESFSLISRIQIPLVARYAISMHKSQGMTLERAIVDLGGSWELGMPYVALSRVRGLDGSKVLDMGSGKANRADEAVKEFMRQTFGRER